MYSSVFRLCAPYRWHSYVRHQQCTVQMTQLVHIRILVFSFFLSFFHTSFRVPSHNSRGLSAECRWWAYSLESGFSKRTNVATSHTNINTGNRKSQNNHKKHLSESRPMWMSVTNASKEDTVDRSENKDVEYMATGKTKSKVKNP